MTASRTTTAEGRALEVRTVGAGPGVVVVHGSAVSAKDYHRFADALADRFTVHLYDRRGRGGRGPVDDSHGVAADVDDLRAVLRHTGARRVVAHSYGGLVALQSALRVPVERLALVDPAVSVDGGFPSGYVEPFTRAATAGDFPLAMAVLSRGLQSVGPVSRLPVPVQRVLAHAFAATAAGREWRTMLPSAVVEAREVLAYDGPADAYSAITADVLLLTGARSPGYFARAALALLPALPGARYAVVPGAGHNAINLAAAPLMSELVDFLA
jgi:pimeloyl-ACP methyl ester carboxylesterase